MLEVEKPKTEGTEKVPIQTGTKPVSDLDSEDAPDFPDSELHKVGKMVEIVKTKKGAKKKPLPKKKKLVSKPKKNKKSLKKRVRRKKPKDDLRTIMNFKVSKAERNAIQKNANRFSRGSLSKYLRKIATISWTKTQLSKVWKP